MRYHYAIWCSRCTGKVFLCGASRQPPSLWNYISNILFGALTGHISTAHSSHSSPAASRDSSKWSKKPQWHPAFFFFPEKPLSFCGESSLSDTVACAGLRGAEGVEAERQSSLECLKWTYNFRVDLRYSDQLDILEFFHLCTFKSELWLFICGSDSTCSLDRYMSLYVKCCLCATSQLLLRAVSEHWWI